MKVELVTKQESIGELRDGDELVVAPALPDVECRRVLPHDGLLGIQEVDEFYLVVVFIMIFIALVELQEH